MVIGAETCRYENMGLWGNKPKRVQCEK